MIFDNNIIMSIQQRRASIIDGAQLESNGIKPFSRLWIFARPCGRESINEPIHIIILKDPGIDKLSVRRLFVVRCRHFACANQITRRILQHLERYWRSEYSVSK